jgi:hypothetical protein
MVIDPFSRPISKADVCVIEIEGLGVLRNPVADEM